MGAKILKDRRIKIVMKKNLCGIKISVDNFISNQELQKELDKVKDTTTGKPFLTADEKSVIITFDNGYERRKFIDKFENKYGEINCIYLNKIEIEEEV